MWTILHFIFVFLSLRPVFGAPSPAQHRERGIPAALHELRPNAEPIAGSYIVSLAAGSDVDGVIAALPDAIAGNIRHSYRNALVGFSGDFDAAQLLVLRQLPEVAYVSPDQMLHTHIIESPCVYNLAIDSETGNGRLAPDNQTHYYYYASKTNRPTRTFIIDTGIDDTNPEFQGRAYQAVNFVRGENNQDVNGHGTHVAGIVGSKTYGVYKPGYLTGIRVCGADGCATSDTVAGIDYAIKHSRDYVSVINMSLGGPYIQALNDAANNAVDHGVAVVVSAGNDRHKGFTACDYSPSSADRVITVGSIDTNYELAFDSGEDRCVDIHAPGVDIVSTHLGHRNVRLSGTSMAAPGVAGILAYYVDQFGSTNPDFLRNELKKFQDRFLIGDKYTLNGAPNSVANNGFFKYQHISTSPHENAEA